MDIVNKELDMPSAGIQHYHDPDISFYSEELELISHSSTKISFTKAFINYFKSIMGISILAVPQVAN